MAHRSRAGGWAAGRSADDWRTRESGTRTAVRVPIRVFGLARSARTVLKPHSPTADMTVGEEVRRTTPRFVQTTLKGVNQVLINSLKSRRDGEEGFTLIELMVVV